MSNLTPQETKEIAKEAYIFGFPFVTNYRAFIYPLISGHPLMQGAELNQFAHNRQLFPPTTADTTQRDTIFSLGILDLRREPMVISVPDVPERQVYMLQLGDTSTESLPYISTRPPATRPVVMCWSALISRAIYPHPGLMGSSPPAASL